MIKEKLSKSGEKLTQIKQKGQVLDIKKINLQKNP